MCCECDLHLNVDLSLASTFLTRSAPAPADCTASRCTTTGAGSADTPQVGESAEEVGNEDGGAVKCGTFGNRQGLRAKMEGGPFCHAMSL